MRAFPHSRYSSPHGGQLLALERNILKYRCFQMMLCLFYAERLRKFLLITVYPATSRSAGSRLDRSMGDEKALTILNRVIENAVSAGAVSAAELDGIKHVLEDRRKQGKRLKLALAYAVDRGFLSSSESSELQTLLDHRNRIAHELHHLTADLSPTNLARDFVKYLGVRYDYNALDRLRFFCRNLPNRVARKLTVILSFDALLFEAADKILSLEIKRLHGVIDKQIANRREEIANLNREISVTKLGLIGDRHPRYPSNRYKNGRLTPRGIEICYRLFDAGKRPLAVAYIMGMGHRAAFRRHKKWLAAGGARRERANIARDGTSKRK